jgi:crotonobetainyl-CoA:carnitine CoA-transferase CaiB-like acyl-CoA transferase
MVLADYGANVVEVEEPGSGDGTRGWGPPWVGDQSAYFLTANRNKRSLTVDLKTTPGQQIVQQLALCSDVLVENFKVGDGSPARGSTTPRSLHATPVWSTARSRAYGQTGPACERPATILWCKPKGASCRSQGRWRAKPARSVWRSPRHHRRAFAATAILAALHRHAASGQGQWIEHCPARRADGAWLANVAQNYLVTRRAPSAIRQCPSQHCAL